MLKDSNTQSFSKLFNVKLHEYGNNSLAISSRGGILTGIGHQRWCTDRTWTGGMVY